MMQKHSIARAVAGARWNPRDGLIGGDQGLWLDPSDLTTMFQDSAGTTPVTAVEQPVGLILDKSKGFGTELVVNGTFLSNTDGWFANANNSSIALDAGTLRLNRTSLGGKATAYTSIPVTTGKKYLLIGDITANSGSGTMGLLYFSASSSATDPLAGTYGTISVAIGKRYLVFTAPSNTTYIHIVIDNVSSQASVNIDNISVRELPGNHAFQSTSANRPTLSARYNLLTKTERFFETWTPDNVTVSTGNFIKENTATAAHDTYQTYTALPIGSYTFTVAVSKTFVGSRNFCIAPFGSTGVGGTGSKGIVFNQTGQFVSFTGIGTDPTYSVTEYSDRFVVSVTGFTTTQATAYPAIYLANGASTSYAGDNTSGMTLLYASLVPANQSSLPYQSVNTATDYDSDQTKFSWYLKFNGTSSSLQTASINFTATDKMFVSAGVRKLSDATAGILAELSANSATNNGTLAVISPPTLSSTYGFASKGATLQQSNASGFAAPITNVISGIGDISGDQTILRVNGTQAATNTADQGTGNYGNYPLYIGARAGTSLFFNGNLYQLVICGRPTAVPIDQITRTEEFVNRKTKAY